MTTQPLSLDTWVAQQTRRGVHPPALAVAEAVAEAVAGASAEARRNPAHGSTGAAGDASEALALAREALRNSRDATGVVQEIMACASAMGAAPEAATETADHIQAESEALLALALRLTWLAQALHDAAEGLRPSPERRRAALAENLQRFKEQHLALLRRAEAMLAGGQPFSPHQLVSAENCALGQWWMAAKQAGWEGAPAFLALERPHQAFHRALAGLLFAHQQGRTELAQALLAELRSAAAVVVGSLDMLCAHILEPNDPAGEPNGTRWDEADEAALRLLQSGRIVHAPLGFP